MRATVAVRFESRATVTAVAGGKESHRTPAKAAVNGEDRGGSTYQSPLWPFVGHRSSAFLAPGSAVNSRARCGSPVAMTSRAPAAARVRSAIATGASVAPSRQRPASVSTNTRAGKRATSLSVRARNRASQSGGDAKMTAAGSRLKSIANNRASSRGSVSPTPSRRTSSTDQPGRGTWDAGRVISVVRTPLSGRATDCEASRRPSTDSVSVALPVPRPPSLFPAVP